MAERLDGIAGGGQPRPAPGRGPLQPRAPGLRLIRLAVRCPPEQADLVLAELTVLAPNGVEEEHGPGYVEYAIYGGEGELPELGELDAVVGRGRIEVSSHRDPRRLGRPLARLPQAAAGRRAALAAPVLGGPARGSDRCRRRPRPGLRHRRPPDHAALPGVPAGAGGGRGGLRTADRPRHRLRRAGDRGREARLGSGPRLRPRAAGARGGGGQRRGQRSRARTRADQPPRTPAVARRRPWSPT